MWWDTSIISALGRPGVQSKLRDISSSRLAWAMRSYLRQKVDKIITGGNKNLNREWDIGRVG